MSSKGLIIIGINGISYSTTTYLGGILYCHAEGMRKGFASVYFQAITGVGQAAVDLVLQSMRWMQHVRRMMIAIVLVVIIVNAIMNFFASFIRSLIQILGWEGKQVCYIIT